jgi:uncharacterized protein (DUF302 family)
MIYEKKSSRTWEEIDQALHESAARHKFGVITVHDLQKTMQNKGVEFPRRVLIYEVCNPQQAKKVLMANGAVSTALPCRISVYEADDGVRVATMLPTAMMQMFNEPGLQPVAEEVEAVVKAMIDEAS